MRALAISAVVGAMVLTGCQSTGNNTGGVEYDKAALGTLIGAAAGYGVSKGNANTSRQNNRAAAIGAVLGGATGVYLDNKEKKLRQHERKLFYCSDEQLHYNGVSVSLLSSFHG